MFLSNITSSKVCITGAAPHVSLKTQYQDHCLIRFAYSFYSWRRYCNKHQIRLGGYAMADRSPSPSQDNQSGEGDQEEPSANPPGPGTIAAARARALADVGRTRSPTPPRALFRSTTGKGVAFTEEDVTFLVRFMEYKKCVLITAFCRASHIDTISEHKDDWIWWPFGRKLRQR